MQVQHACQRQGGGRAARGQRRVRTRQTVGGEENGPCRLCRAAREFGMQRAGVAFGFLGLFQRGLRGLSRLIVAGALGRGILTAQERPAFGGQGGQVGLATGQGGFRLCHGAVGGAGRFLGCRKLR